MDQQSRGAGAEEFGLGLRWRNLLNVFSRASLSSCARDSAQYLACARTTPQWLQNQNIQTTRKCTIYFSRLRMATKQQIGIADVHPEAGGSRLNFACLLIHTHARSRLFVL